jgi:glycosyltransferase involved in cell wall biosynthesis
MCRVSIIIPNYNHAKYLPQRLESVYNQTYKDFEVILLDDCSTDESAVILNTYANHPKTSHVVINKTNSGSTFKQWEKGLSLAQGEYIWIAESDDVAYLHFLERIVPYLQNGNEVSMVNCLSDIINTEGDFISKQLEWIALKNSNILLSFDGEEFIKEYMLNSNPIINASACLIRKKAFKEIPFEKINFKLNGDWLIYILLLRGSKITLLPEYLNQFRTHRQSVRTTSLNIIPHKEHIKLLAFLKKEDFIPKGLLKRQVYSPLFVVLNFETESRNYLKAFRYLLETAQKMELSTMKVTLQYLKYRFLKLLYKK